MGNFFITDELNASHITDCMGGALSVYGTILYRASNPSMFTLHNSQVTRRQGYYGISAESSCEGTARLPITVFILYAALMH